MTHFYFIFYDIPPSLPAIYRRAPPVRVFNYRSDPGGVINKHVKHLIPSSSGTFIKIIDIL